MSIDPHPVLTGGDGRVRFDLGWLLAEAARLRETAVKDKSYQATPIGQLVRRYLDECAFASQQERTIENREQTLAWLALDLAHLEPDEVRAEHLVGFLTEHWRDAKPATRRQNTSNVRVFFTWAHESDLIPANPARRLPRVSVPDSDRVAHAASVILRLISGQDSRRDRAALLTLYWCALRRNELRQAQIGHFDLHNRRMTVHGKGGRVAEQNIPEQLAGELEAHILLDQRQSDEYLLYPQKTGMRGSWPLQERGVIWEDRLRPFTPSGIDLWWWRCLDRAGLDRFPMHEMRHTAGTHFHQAGHDLVATQHFMRHRNPATTANTYIHLDRARAIAEIQRNMPNPLDWVDE
jgi:integrase